MPSALPDRYATPRGLTVLQRPENPSISPGDPFPRFMLTRLEVCESMSSEVRTSAAYAEALKFRRSY